MTGVSVTSDLFHVLRVQAALGRTLTSLDDLDSSPRTVVLSDGLWRAKFGGDRGVLGRTIVLDDVSHVIVGVMPPSFDFPSRDTEYWVPDRFTPASLADRTDTYLDVVARLKDNVSLQDARSEMRVIAAQLERAYPKENAQTGATVQLLRNQVSRQSRTMLMTLVGAALCMLLIACTNLANLLLARGLVTAEGAGRAGCHRRGSRKADPTDLHGKHRVRRARRCLGDRHRNCVDAARITSGPAHDADSGCPKR